MASNTYESRAVLQWSRQMHVFASWTMKLGRDLRDNNQHVAFAIVLQRTLRKSTTETGRCWSRLDDTFLLR